MKLVLLTKLMDALSAAGEARKHYLYLQAIAAMQGTAVKGPAFSIMLCSFYLLLLKLILLVTEEEDE